MSTRGPTVAFTFVLGIVLAAPTITLAAVDPSRPYVESISYGGTGCPQGSVGSSLANDRRSFTLIFDVFVASTGASVPLTESQKSCQVNVHIHFPDGSSASSLVVDYRGYVSTPANVTGEQKATYDLAGATLDERATSFDGPVNKDYLASDTVPVVVTTGGGNVDPVSMSTRVRLTGAAGLAAQITTDSIDGKLVDDPDTDHDGVPNEADACPGTVLPESVPTDHLGTSRFANVDADGIFDTAPPKGKGPRRSYTIADTAGCSCEQIIAATGAGEGHVKNGCSIGLLDEWISAVTR